MRHCVYSFQKASRIEAVCCFSCCLSPVRSIILQYMHMCESLKTIQYVCKIGRTWERSVKGPAMKVCRCIWSIVPSTNSCSYKYPRILLSFSLPIVTLLWLPLVSLVTSQRTQKLLVGPSFLQKFSLQTIYSMATSFSLRFLSQSFFLKILKLIIGKVCEMTYLRGFWN